MPLIFRIVKGEPLTFLEGDNNLRYLEGLTVSSSANFSNWTGSSSSQFAGTASLALTASYALNAGTTVDTGSLVSTASFNSFTSSYNTGSFTGTFNGDLIGTASYVNLSAGPGIIINGLEITSSVRTVNGIFPTNGNIPVALSATITGTSASLASSGSGNITGSIPDGLVWIISNDPTPANNGDVYIYSSGSVGAWYQVAPLDQAASDARYIKLDGANTPMTGDLNMGGNNINNVGMMNGTASFAISSSFSPNIYNTNGSLTGARTLTLNSNPLDIIGSTTTRFFANGDVGIGITTSSNYKLDVNGSSRIRGGLRDTVQRSINGWSVHIATFDYINSNSSVSASERGSCGIASISSSGVFAFTQDNSTNGPGTAPGAGVIDLTFQGSTNFSQSGTWRIKIMQVVFGGGVSQYCDFILTGFAWQTNSSTYPSRVDVLSSNIQMQISTYNNGGRPTIRLFRGFSHIAGARYYAIVSEVVGAGFNAGMAGIFNNPTIELRCFNESTETPKSFINTYTIPLQVGNVYNQNGTLTSNRTLTLSSSYFDVSGATTSRFFANGNVGIGTTIDGGFKLDVNGTTRLQGALSVSTGGATIIGNTTVTGSLNISGSGRFTDGLTVTGSFTVVTGSSREFQVRNTGVDIGSIITDVHTVTGSINVSGSGRFTDGLTVTGSLNLATGSVTISTGSVTMPNRPAFRVVGTSSSDVTAITILSGSAVTVDYNQDNCYNNTTGLFTAPIAGLYHVYLNARVGSVNSQMQAIVYKNTNIVQLMWEAPGLAASTHFGVSGIVRLAVNDTLQVTVAVGSIQFDANDSWGAAYIG